MWTKILVWWTQLCANKSDFTKYSIQTRFSMPCPFAWEKNTLEIYDEILIAMALADKNNSTDSKAAKAMRIWAARRVPWIMKLDTDEHTKGLLLREAFGIIKLMKMSPADKKVLLGHAKPKPKG